MFFGSFPTRVDDKGRLKLPADYKQIVDAQYGNEFYITSQDGKRAQLYPMKEWLKKVETLDRIPASNPIRRRFLDATSRMGQKVEMDGQGRLLLPQILRDEAKLVDDVEIIGMKDILEVARRVEFKEAGKPMTEEEMALAAELGL